MEKNLRSAADRRLEKIPIFDQAPPARSFGDQNFSVGQEGNAPWRVEVADEGLETKRRAFALHGDLDWRGRQLDPAGGEFFALLADEGDQRALFRFAHGLAKRRHARLRPAVANAPQDAFRIAPVIPKRIQRIRPGVAGERGPMAVGAELGANLRGLPVHCLDANRKRHECDLD